MNTIPVRALINIRFSCSILAGRIYRKTSEVVKNKCIEASKRHENLHSANTTSVPLITDFDAELKVGGLVLATTVADVDKVSYDLIQCMNFFSAN